MAHGRNGVSILAQNVTMSQYEDTNVVASEFDDLRRRYVTRTTQALRIGKGSPTTLSMRNLW